MKYLIFILLSIACISALSAQENSFEFNLTQALDYALQHNKTLLNANKDIQLANKQINEAAASGLPQVNGTVDYMTNFNYEFDLEFGAGAAVPLVMEDQASANVQVTQLIFSGQYWLGLQMAKTGRQIAENNRNLTELDIKENVINTYYLILVTEELFRIIEENQNNLKEVLKHTTDMYHAGIAEQTDVDQIRINVSLLENSKKAMERNLQLNKNMFRMVLGIESENEIVLTDSLSNLMEFVDKDKIWNNGQDYTHNPAYQMMLSREKLGEKKVTLQKWAYAPTLSGYYSYKEKILTTGFDLSPKNAAGLTLSVPIFSGGTRRARLSQAKIELDKIVRSKSLLEEQLEVQEKQLIFEVKNAHENYITQKENVEVAQRVYNHIYNKYKQGMVSSLDLTQANSNYLQAENNYISAMLSLLQAKLRLDKLYNNI